MKTSLVIPATNGNFNYLRCILSHYQDGTVRPDQVVISLSNAHLVGKNKIERLKIRFDGFFDDLKIIEHNCIMVQGPNRDSATMAAENEIIISNDADDIPHPQRIEVIKWFFENHDIYHLNHSYQTRDDCIFKPVNIEDVKVLNAEETFKHHFPKYNGEKYSGRRPDPRKYGHNHPYGAYVPWGADDAIHAGCPSFHKNVFKELRWRQTEEYAWDWDFDMDVLFHFRKSILINSKLLWYNLLPTQLRRDNADPRELGILYKE